MNFDQSPRHFVKNQYVFILQKVFKQTKNIVNICLNLKNYPTPISLSPPIECVQKRDLAASAAKSRIMKSSAEVNSSNTIAERVNSYQTEDNLPSSPSDGQEEVDSSQVTK